MVFSEACRPETPSSFGVVAVGPLQLQVKNANIKPKNNPSDVRDRIRDTSKDPIFIGKDSVLLCRTKANNFAKLPVEGIEVKTAQFWEMFSRKSGEPLLPFTNF
jgi:hypothetical protein